MRLIGSALGGGLGLCRSRSVIPAVSPLCYPFLVERHENLFVALQVAGHDSQDFSLFSPPSLLPSRFLPISCALLRAFLSCWTTAVKTKKSKRKEGRKKEGRKSAGPWLVSNEITGWEE